MYHASTASRLTHHGHFRASSGHTPLHLALETMCSHDRPAFAVTRPGPGRMGARPFKRRNAIFRGVPARRTDRRFLILAAVSHRGWASTCLPSGLTARRRVCRSSWGCIEPALGMGARTPRRLAHPLRRRRPGQAHGIALAATLMDARISSSIVFIIQGHRRGWPAESRRGAGTSLKRLSAGRRRTAHPLRI